MKTILPVFMGGDGRRSAVLTLLATALAVVAVAGCGKGGGDSKAKRSRGPRTFVVETVKVTQRDWKVVAPSVGSMAADEFVTVRNEVAGFVREIPASEGSAVKKGDLLMRIDDSKLSIEVKRAEAKYDDMRANVLRKKPLFEQKMIAEAEMISAEANFKSAEAELELARRRLADAQVFAPMNGELGRRHVAVGDYVTAGAKLFDLVKMDVMKLEFGLPERYLPLLEVGQEVRVHTPAYPEKKFTGKVDFIDPLVDISTRTIRLRALVDNPESLLRPNLFVNVELDVDVIKDALVVPEEAIVSSLGGFSVFVIGAEDTAQQRKVELGERERAWVQVVKGLKVGERIVASGHLRLFPGAKVMERSEMQHGGPPFGGPPGGGKPQGMPSQGGPPAQQRPK